MRLKFSRTRTRTRTREEDLCGHDPAHNFVIECLIADDPMLQPLPFTQLKAGDYLNAMTEPCHVLHTE